MSRDGCRADRSRPTTVPLVPVRRTATMTADESWHQTAARSAGGWFTRSASRTDGRADRATQRQRHGGTPARSQSVPGRRNEIKRDVHAGAPSPQWTPSRQRIHTMRLWLAVWQSAGLAIGRLQVRISARATSHQGLLSLPSLRGL